MGQGAFLFHFHISWWCKRTMTHYLAVTHLDETQSESFLFPRSTYNRHMAVFLTGKRQGL